jgi:hypothetical protein
MNSVEHDEDGAVLVVPALVQLAVNAAVVEAKQLRQ